MFDEEKNVEVGFYALKKSKIIFIVKHVFKNVCLI
jgi:hypothetical protein